MGVSSGGNFYGSDSASTPDVWGVEPTAEELEDLAALLEDGKDQVFGLDSLSPGIVIPTITSTLSNQPEPLVGNDRSDHGRLQNDKSWQDLGNCLGVDPDLFFPERGASAREAKEVCRGCTVREDCLDYALMNGEKFGIWGGLSERERRRIRRQRALARRALIDSSPSGPNDDTPLN